MSPSRYKARERAWPYMGFVKTLPCLVYRLSHGGHEIAHHFGDRIVVATLILYGGPCAGVIEADHAGRRPIGRKAGDETCIPLCTLHHRQRTDHSGAFREIDKLDMRSFLRDAIRYTQHVARSRGVEVPQCAT